MGQKYDWKIGQNPPLIDPHSIVKHKVYEEYLSHYIQVLNANPRIPASNLRIIDGFAGGGEYLDGEKQIYKGSPLRLLEAAEEGAALVNLQRQNTGMTIPFTLNSDFYFTERNKHSHNYLNWCLKNYGYENRIGKNIFTFQADFKKALPAIIDNIKKKGASGSGRCLFFLDQYGYKEVPFDVIRKIFHDLKNAEIVLTFATDYLIDFINNDEKSSNIIKKLNLKEHVPLQPLLDAKEDTPGWRRFVQSKLHQPLVNSSGAKYFTPFFITSAESNRSFWLVHLSNHPTARDVMTALHWKHKNQFEHYLESGIYMFGYNPAKDESISIQTPLLGLGEDSIKYEFDEQARERTLNRLLIDIPEFLTDYKDGIMYEDFYKKVCNHTPATSHIIKEGLQNLLNDSDIFIISEKKSKRRSSNQIKKTDILKINRQMRFLYT